MPLAETLAESTENYPLKQWPASPVLQEALSFPSHLHFEATAVLEGQSLAVAHPLWPVGE